MAMLNHNYHDRKKRKDFKFLLWLCIASVILLGSSPHLFHGYELNINAYESIAPVSIPVIEDPNNPTDGTSYLGVTRLRWRSQQFASNNTDTTITSITVQLVDNPDGSFSESNIEKISIYFEPKGGNNDEFDRGVPGDETYVADESQNGDTPYTFDSGDTKQIFLTPGVVETDSNSWAHLWIVFDIAYDAEITGTIRCLITEVAWEDSSSPPQGPPYSGTWTPTAGEQAAIIYRDVDTYKTSITVTGIAPATGEQGENDVPVLQIQLNADDATMDAADPYRNINLDSITVHLTGDNYADIDPGGFSLYDDANNNGVIDGGETTIPSAVIPMTPAEYITINPLSNVTFDETQISLIVAVNVAETAIVDNTVGLEIEDPSSDIAFNDIVDDTDITFIGVYYAYVSTEYVQAGYISDNLPTPGTGNTFTVTPLPDTDPPQIAATVPRNNESGVTVNTDVTIIFNEDINPSTVTGTNFYVEDSASAPVSGTVSASGSEAIFTPDSNFNYEEIYTATLEPGVEDIYGNAMTSTYTWSFATTANVARPVAANNRILPGSTDPVQIHIPEPAGGPSEKVTVQVFTTTGKKVATLIDNRPYSQIESQLPLLWYGKNSRQQDLGPGLYFIQVITGSDKTVLKVLIVR